MATAILLMGKSGSGKSSSLRNVKQPWLVININKKPMPFKTNPNLKIVNTDEYLQIRGYLKAAYEKGVKSVLLDDAGYLLTAKFMAGHRGKTGNQTFELYNEIGDNFYSLIKYIVDELPSDMNVYIVMHEDKNEFGDIKPKTIGKLLDDKVCIEGMFTIVLRALKVDGKYLFSTNTDGLDVTKTPMGMFDQIYIDNDLDLVDNTIREYYKEEK